MFQKNPLILSSLNLAEKLVSDTSVDSLFESILTSSRNSSIVTSFWLEFSRHIVWLGQHFPNGLGAIVPSWHRSTKHLTDEQSELSHWSDLGQHSPKGMGANSPVGQNSGIHVTWSHCLWGHSSVLGQHSPNGTGAKSPLGQNFGWEHSHSDHWSTLSKQ